MEVDGSTAGRRRKDDEEKRRRRRLRERMGMKRVIGGERGRG